MAFENIEKQMSVARPDIIEILPGLMPKVIRRVCRLVKVPVIAGGTYIRQGRCDGQPRVSRAISVSNNESEGMADVNIEA